MVGDSGRAEATFPVAVQEAKKYCIEADKKVLEKSLEYIDRVSIVILHCGKSPIRSRP